MKSKTTIDGTKATITVTAENGSTFDLNYRVDSAKFMNAIATIESQSKVAESGDQSRQIAAVMKIFKAWKNVIGESNFDALNEWADDNDEEIGVIEFMGFIKTDVDEDTPKE